MRLFWFFFCWFWPVSAWAAGSWIALAKTSLAPQEVVIGHTHFVFLEAPSILPAAHLEPDQMVTVSSLSISDPHPDWASSVLGLPEAWRLSRGRGVLVAVLDTGLALRHPDLKPNLWRNLGEDWLDSETPGYNGLDDDGNGVVDDYYGYNALEDSGHVEDDNGHGTAMAEIIGGACQRRCGVAPAVKILPIKVLDNEGYGYVSSVIKGLAYALEVQHRSHQPLILNLSFTLPYPSTALREAMKEAGRLGVKLFVTAAGNQGLDLHVYPLYPAAFGLPEVVTVASLGPDLRLSWFSSFGPSLVDLAAPGEDIFICPAAGPCEWASGTSLATAYVTGVLALLAARLPQAPSWELKAVLFQGAICSPLLEPLITQGRVAHAQRALERALGLEPADLSGDHHLGLEDYLALGLRFWDYVSVWGIEVLGVTNR